MLLFLSIERRPTIFDCDWTSDVCASQLIIRVFFFFSSRRRHTRFDCDWSSDVCSSDLNALYRNNHDGTFTDVTEKAGVAGGTFGMGVAAGDYDNDGNIDLFVTAYGKCQIGRASCRERV